MDWGIDEKAPKKIQRKQSSCKLSNSVFNPKDDPTCMQLFSRPYQRSRLRYDVSSVCRL